MAEGKTTTNQKLAKASNGAATKSTKPTKSTKTTNHSADQPRGSKSTKSTSSPKKKTGLIVGICLAVLLLLGGAVVAALAIGGVFSGLSGDYESGKENHIGVDGQYSNMGGVIAKQDRYLYYSLGGSSLYKIPVGATKSSKAVTKLYEGSGEITHINVVGDYIYFLEEATNGLDYFIVKMRLDGTEAECLRTLESPESATLVVREDTMYFGEMSVPSTSGQRPIIAQMKTDGSDYAVVSDIGTYDKQVLYVSPNPESVFFSHISRHELDSGRTLDLKYWGPYSIKKGDTEETDTLSNLTFLQEDFASSAEPQVEFKEDGFYTIVGTAVNEESEGWRYLVFEPYTYPTDGYGMIFNPFTLYDQVVDKIIPDSIAEDMPSYEDAYEDDMIFGVKSFHVISKEEVLLKWTFQKNSRTTYTYYIKFNPLTQEMERLPDYQIPMADDGVYLYYGDGTRVTARSKFDGSELDEDLSWMTP